MCHRHKQCKHGNMARSHEDENASEFLQSLLLLTELFVSDTIMNRMNHMVMQTK